MDTSDPEISFNALGQCNHCCTFLEKTSKLTYQGAETDRQRDALIAEMKRAGRGKEYDCVIGISGGVDSCYVAYKAKELGLRALLVHLDNGWNSDTAVKNIKAVVDTFGFDYQSHVLNWADFKAIQVGFLKASILDAEIPTDVAIPASWHTAAAQHGVKYIIAGGNFTTEGILPKSWGYNAKDKVLFGAIVKQFVTRKLGPFPSFSFRQELAYKYVNGIRVIYLLNYVPYSKADAIQTLEKEIGWTRYGGKHYESRYTGFLQSYILPVKFNVDYRRATYSTQICTGEMTREDALKDLEKLSYDPEKVEVEKAYICKKLDLSLSEFEAILKLPPKTYRDYPNGETFLSFAYKVYRMLKRS
jgi:N-acetyl sugar amidotransferase